MKEENNTMEARFKARYDKSHIYHPVNMDWFPDDVMQFIRMEKRLAEESLVRRVVSEIGKIPTRCIECDKIGRNPYGECQCSYGGEKRYLKKIDIFSIPSLTPKPEGDEK